MFNNFGVDFFDSPLNCKAWSKISLKLSVPLKTIQFFLHSSFSRPVIPRLYSPDFLIILYIQLAYGTTLSVLKVSKSKTILLLN